MNIENLLYIKKFDVSLLNILLLYYLIQANNKSDLLGHQFKEYLENNRIAEHLIAFLLLFVLIIIIGKVNDIKIGLSYSMLAYLWFILSTKLELQFNIMILLILVFGFIYENRLINVKNEIENNENFTQDDLDKINGNFELSRRIIFSFLLVVTFFGVYFYTNKKMVQYGGGDFNIVKFLFY